MSSGFDRPGGAPFSAWGILVAAGFLQCMEMDGDKPITFFPTAGVPLYWHGVRALARVPQLEGLIIVLPESLLNDEEAAIEKRRIAESFGIPLHVVAGGKTHFASVGLALSALPPSCTHVLIHDGARPFVTTALCARVLEALLAGNEAVTVAIPVNDNVKRVSGRVLETVRCDTLCYEQTPCGFFRPLLEKARALPKACELADDVELIEALGKDICILPGEVENRKMTSPADLTFLTSQAYATTIGQGYDVHRFGGSRPLILGGVPIPSTYCVEAHSDGDVLLHAVMDALLGAAALGDIGQHFPDSDPRFLGVSSSLLLDHVLSLLAKKHIVPLHLDATIIAEKPKIAPFREEIRANIARLLSLTKDAVNIKATTEERLGFTGRLEGIKAQAVVLCRRLAQNAL